MTSSLVIGLGDEVLLMLFTLLLGGLFLLAWASSFVGERPRVEAVLIQPMGQVDNNASQESNVQRARVLWAEPRRGGTVPTVATPEPMTEATSSEAVTEEVAMAAEETATAAVPQETAAPSTEVEEAAGSKEESSESNSETVREREDTPALEESSTTTTEAASETPSEATPSTPSTSESVNIKVKFLNDTQREVKASLRDRLGRFKQKHLSDLLGGNQSVRLIFNGHVLRGEEQTLSQCGLFDNCVVHCLVTEQAAQPQTQQGPNRPGQVQTDGGHFLAPDSDDLDLSHICYPMLGSVLLIIWWCQLVYSHYFSLTSTVSLVSLTILFLASITNTYITDG